MQRTENRCPKLLADHNGARLDCFINEISECPKSRNKMIITTACWRVRE